MPTGLKNIVSGGPNQADEKPFTPWPAGVATQKSRMLYLVVQWFIVCAREIAKPQHQASGHVAFGSNFAMRASLRHGRFTPDCRRNLAMRY
jgi:hypothetical protein